MRYGPVGFVLRGFIVEMEEEKGNLMSFCKGMGVFMFVMAGVLELLGVIIMFACWPYGIDFFLAVSLMAVLPFVFGCCWMALDEI